MQICRVCTHTDGPKIDDLLRAGKAVRLIARSFGLTKDSLSRHKVAHLHLAKAWRRRAPSPIPPPVEVPSESDNHDSSPPATATLSALQIAECRATLAEVLHDLCEIPIVPGTDLRQRLSLLERIIDRYVWLRAQEMKGGDEHH